MSTIPPTSSPDTGPLQFSIGGQVTAWDPIDRRLDIGPRSFWVAPSADVTRLAPGVRVSLTGHVDRPDSSAARWTVTHVAFE
jgi:hypothetical protein